MSTLVSIFGPTSSGKSALALDLARRLPGSVIVGADSRQVYRRLDIGTGKEPGRWQTHPQYGPIYTVEGVPHALIDYRDPRHQITLVDYARDFTDFAAAHNPEAVILVGGTGLYLDALTLKKTLTYTRPDYEAEAGNYKTELQRLNRKELQLLADEARLQLNHSDYHNPRRLVARLTEKKAREENWLDILNLPSFDNIYRTALAPSWPDLQNRITKRLQDRFNQGLIEETRELQDLGTKRLLQLGLEYRLTQLHLLGHLTYKEYKQALLRENLRLAKRQLTWHNPKNTIEVKTTKDILKLLKPQSTKQKSTG